MDLFGIDKRKKIIISGGWGYANLGDDAILISTIENILDVCQDVDIVVLSSNVSETYLNIHNLFSNIEIVDSFHSLLLGDQKRSQSVLLSNFGYYNLILKLLNKIQYSIKKKLSLHYYKNYLRVFDFLDSYKSYNYKRLFKEADLYIMSGGGFLNDWIDIDVSKFLEVSYASKYGLPVVVLGQTIGPFKNTVAKSITHETLKNASDIIFRDSDSYKDFDIAGMEIPFTKAMPDIATSSLMTFSKRKYITFIPYNREIIDNIDIIIKNLGFLQKKTELTIVITVSQLWPWTIKIATQFTMALLSKGLKVDLKIPRTYSDLQDMLGKSSLVISQNLHGLIMAYRAGTPIISLNGRRKFKTFMEKVNLSNSILIPKDIKNEDEFYRKYFDSLKETNISEIFKNEVHSIFVYILNKYGFLK